MTASAMETEKLDLGRVIQLTFSGLRRNIGPLAPVVGLFSILPAILGLIVSFTLLSAMQTQPAAAFSSPFYYLNLVVSLLAWAAFQATGTLILVSDMRNAPVGFAESVRKSVRHILPLFAIIVLYILAVWVGTVFLIVPGLILAATFSMAVPSRIIEGKGVFAAFGQSRDLTRRNRLRIIGLVLIYVVFLLALSFGVYALFGGFASAATLGMGPRIVLTVLSQIISIAFGLISLSGACAMYAELRRIKDGVGTGDLASIFD